MSIDEPYRYTVQFPAPITHYAEVEALFPSDGASSLDLFMAVWTPGSYLVREYARHIEKLTAFDEKDNALTIRKTRKNRWSIETTGLSLVRVGYRVYCREMSVRTNWVDERFALLQGAATYLSVQGKQQRAHEITLILPPGWSRTVTGLTEIGTHRYTAPDYDTLVDSPILAGNPSVYEFDVDGKKHLFANDGEDGIWDGPRSVGDVEKIVRRTQAMWGSLPYDRYVFLNVLLESGARGGLEHKNSCCVMTSRYAGRTRGSYVWWLELVSHEYFHVWNVKRLRPVELGPFDYENENYTRALWIAEGFTEYYGRLILARAGLVTREEYLNGAGSGDKPGGLSGVIETLQTTPGRLSQPVELSSFDAWIKAYRPDENSINTAISYYTKGAVIAFLLDAKVRMATGGAKSLDDVMRLAYERFSGDRGFDVAGFKSAAEAVAGIDLGEWFRRAVETTEELHYDDALSCFGLRFRTAQKVNPKAWTGMTTKTESGRLVVATVPRGTPAFEAGFSAEDEIIAIGEYRVLPEQWPQRMEQFHAGETLAVLISRRGRLTTVTVTLAEDPRGRWTLEVNPEATPEQSVQLNAWLT
jgi:predicted metalloprotease with PDZ domain